MKKMFLFAALLSALLTTEAFALDKPVSGSADKRVLYSDYREGEVYPLEAVNGLVTTVIFAPDEEVKSFASGFSSAWEFASRGNHFFLKPKAKQGTTNLVVITNKHTYLFDIRLGYARKKASYQLSFRYPQEEARKALEKAQRQTVEELLKTKENTEDKEAVEKLNHNYTMNFGAAASSRRIAPKQAWDNGEFTFLRFAEQTDYPTVYRVEESEETLLNTHIEKDVLVIHGVFEELRLRAGQAVVGIYNESFSGSGQSRQTGTTAPGVERLIKNRGKTL